MYMYVRCTQTSESGVCKGVQFIHLMRLTFKRCFSIKNLLGKVIMKGLPIFHLVDVLQAKTN